MRAACDKEQRQKEKNMNAGTSPGGLYVDRQAAEEGLRLALPLLERAVADPAIGQSGVLYVVIMDPARPPGSCEFREAILLEHGLGKERSAWDADYAAYARAKAQLSWRTQRDSYVVQTLTPQQVRRDETPLWGSVAIDGFVVGISGLDPIYDEAFSGVVALCLRAAVKLRARGAGRA
jgi:hypothetical protein